MRIIPVIDLLGGQVVRGIAGRRNEYRPLVSSLTASTIPYEVAAVFAEAFAFREVYVADLDAILHGRRDVSMWESIAASGMSLLLDAGIQTADDAVQISNLLSEFDDDSKFVIGLESLRSQEELAKMAARISSFAGQAIFSVDLQQGQPLAADPSWRSTSPLEIIAAACQCGLRRYILLDLADVGVASGTSTITLLRQAKERFPQIEFIAGGGVRGREDLLMLQTAGAAGVLVASALHDGRLTAEDCR